MHRAPIALLLLAALAGIRTSNTSLPSHSSTWKGDLVDSLLARMTLEEKLGQLTMVSAPESLWGTSSGRELEQRVKKGRVGSFLNLWGSAATRHIQSIALRESRLGIPLLFAQDVIHGWRTVFPVPLAEAATFDTGIVERAARIAAIEASAAGIHWTFAPMVDLARDPRWGRVVEGAGEDPYLGAAMAAARVRGFQGKELRDPQSLLATPKHFAAYGAAEGGRDYNTADVSERTLWDAYFPPFEAAIQGGAGSVMAAFNDIGGTPAHASRWLLTDLLRRRWGFRGLVVSDWDGVRELIPHGVAGNRMEAAARALEAGVDVEMASDLFATDLPRAVQTGRISGALVDSAVGRVLRIKQALGLFDKPHRLTDPGRERTNTLTLEHRRTSREAAQKAVVLLRNERSAHGSPTLPLRLGSGTIAVIGPLADDAQSVLGSWSGAGQASDAVSVLDGIRRRVGADRVRHARGASVDSAETTGFTEAKRLAREADAVVLVLGERANMSGENSSRASLELPGVQLDLARAIVAATRGTKPVVAVLVNGRPLALQWLADSVPAILETWFLGIEHGNAVADILFGYADPAGRLPMSFPRVTGQVPIHYNHRPLGRPPPGDDHYPSGYLDLERSPLWPFGFGLSYTTFAYSNLRLSGKRIGMQDSVTISVDLTNRGTRAGSEVVQLYLRDDVATVARPVRMLRGFQRLTLQPGETRMVTFRLRPHDLALHDLDMRKVVEPGSFTVFVGASSTARLAARFDVTGDTLVLAPAPPSPR